ncbi:hypothetical protein Cadr_000026234 [Camelus dromedarius]|uniref:Uncharacterized protein n=1 Tax=Camelus dromedarius TaxID=9838 RepID=A0A5N4CDP4_CAMDR|nr:hypothetical protein Cadr_000026234 [Camelus dromedarius]
MVTSSWKEENLVFHGEDQGYERLPLLNRKPGLRQRVSGFTNPSATLEVCTAAQLSVLTAAPGVGIPRPPPGHPITCFPTHLYPSTRLRTQERVKGFPAELRRLGVCYVRSPPGDRSPQRLPAFLLHVGEWRSQSSADSMSWAGPWTASSATEFIPFVCSSKYVVTHSVLRKADTSVAERRPPGSGRTRQQVSAKLRAPPPPWTQALPRELCSLVQSTAHWLLEEEDERQKQKTGNAPGLGHCLMFCWNVDTGLDGQDLNPNLYAFLSVLFPAPRSCHLGTARTPGGLGGQSQQEPCPNSDRQQGQSGCQLEGERGASAHGCVSGGAGWRNEARRPICWAKRLSYRQRPGPLEGCSGPPGCHGAPTQGRAWQAPGRMSHQCLVQHHPGLATTTPCLPEARNQHGASPAIPSCRGRGEDGSSLSRKGCCLEGMVLRFGGLPAPPPASAPVILPPLWTSNQLQSRASCLADTWKGVPSSECLCAQWGSLTRGLARSPAPRGRQCGAHWRTDMMPSSARNLPSP